MREVNEAATRIDCILTEQLLCTKFIDYQLEFPLSPLCGPFPLPSGFTTSAALLNINCEVINTSQNPTILLFLVETSVEITIGDENGLEICTFEATGLTTSSAYLGSCPAQGISCLILSQQFLSLEVFNGSQPVARGSFQVCLGLTRDIQLLIPSLGYCIPRACEVEDSDCPPMFPQCNDVSTDA